MAVRSRAVEDTLGAAVTRIIADAAEASDLAQVTLERRTGIGQSQISRSFSGHRVFSIGEADAMCDALGLSFTQVIRDAREAVRMR